ncbi:MAG: hypothetical protein RJA76_150 [Bacteroidota bacterium]|jgi:hypothetical protein
MINTLYFLLLFAQAKDIHFPKQENINTIQIAILDSSNHFNWNRFDTLQIPNDKSSQFSIYINRIIGKPKPLHAFWDFYLDSTHLKFKVLSDSLLGIFPKKPYRMKFVSEYRSLERQEHLLKMGRSKLPISLHNFGFALDVGIYRGRKYLKRGNIYSKMGVKAKEIGLFWGGDFVGFPDPGHIQYFSNSAQFIQQFPWIGFEFLKYQPMFESNYESAVEMGKMNFFQDTNDLIQILKTTFPELKYLSKYAISLPENSDLRNWIQREKKDNTLSIIYHPIEQWVYIQKGLQGYTWKVSN